MLDVTGSAFFSELFLDQRARLFKYLRPLDRVDEGIRTRPWPPTLTDPLLAVYGPQPSRGAASMICRGGTTHDRQSTKSCLGGPINAMGRRGSAFRAMADRGKDWPIRT